MVQPVMKHRPDADDRARAKQKDPYDIAHIRDKIEKQLDAVNAVKGQIAEAEKKAGITEMNEKLVSARMQLDDLEQSLKRQIRRKEEAENRWRYPPREPGCYCGPRERGVATPCVECPIHTGHGAFVREIRREIAEAIGGRAIPGTFYAGSGSSYYVI